MESMLKQSPESSAHCGSTEVSQEHTIHEAPHLISSSYTRASPERHAAAYYQLGHGEAMMVPIVKEEPHPGSLYSVDALGWDAAQDLVHSMSPESASLCKNLSSQLENLRKEFGSCYQHAESSNSHTHFVLHHPHQVQQEHQAMGVLASETSSLATGSDLIGSSSVSLNSDNELLKAAIVSHPSYPELVAAHMNFHKVGAPPEVVSQIDEIIQSFKDFQPAVTTSIGANPELDQFMVSYYSMLMKYEKEMKKTFKEAVAFCKKLEQQLQGVTNTSITSVAASVESDDRIEGYESASDEYDSSAEAEIEVDPMAKDKELKEQLMRKYSGYISSLKHEFLKKKKKGKLPKDSRQQLLNWWSLHYKWPYPSESEKASLAESTGLDQKQINNWFINQRKRHWKPSDELTGQASAVTEANSGA